MSKSQKSPLDQSHPSSRNSRIYGSLAEERVGSYYQAKGGKILAKNFHAPRGEIDLIVLYNDILIFIEVKARSSVLYGRPIEAVNFAKKRAIFHSATYFLYKNKDLVYKNYKIRFDIAEYYLSSGEISIYPAVLEMEGY